MYFPSPPLKQEDRIYQEFWKSWYSERNYVFQASVNTQISRQYGLLVSFLSHLVLSNKVFRVCVIIVLGLLFFKNEGQHEYLQIKGLFTFDRERAGQKLPRHVTHFSGRISVSLCLFWGKIIKVFNLRTKSWFWNIDALCSRQERLFSI